MPLPTSAPSRRLRTATRRRLGAYALAAASGLAALLPAAVPAQQTDSTRAGVARPAPPRRAPAPPPADSVPRPPVSPARAFLYSLLVPGLGQVALDRPNAATLFVGVEILSIAMAQKTSILLRQARRLADDSVTVGYVADSSEGPDQIPDPITGEVTAVACATGEPALGIPASAGGPVPVKCATRYTRARVRARRLQLEDWFAALAFNHLISGADAFVAAQLWDLPGEVSMRAHPRGLTIDASLPW